MDACESAPACGTEMQKQRRNSRGGYIVIKQFKTVDVTVLSDWVVDTSRIS